MPHNETDTAETETTPCDWCGEPVPAGTGVTPDGTVAEFTFCQNCPVEQAWLLEDALTQDGIEAVTNGLSAEKAEQYRDFPTGMKIKFLLKMMEKNIVECSFEPRHEEAARNL